MKNKQKLLTQQGLALPIVLMLSMILISLLGATTMVALGSGKQVKRQFSKEAQASNIARAGLQDALGWFKNQPAQPVRHDSFDTAQQDCVGARADENVHLAFHPQEDLVNPELSETLDESLGIVKELKIQEPDLWGRYVVRRYDCGKPADSEWNKSSVRDITFERGKNDGFSNVGQGVVWYIESEGTVYHKVDPAKEPDQPPNRVVQKASAATEINRLSLNVYKAPVTLTGSSASSFNNKCNLIGDGTNALFGIARNSNNSNYSGSPSISNVTYTSPASIKFAVADDRTVEGTFNMSLEELKASSNAVYEDEKDMVLEPRPENQLIFLEGNGTKTFTFPRSTDQKALQGSGVLVVNGNLDFKPDGNSSFIGLVYVTGTFKIRESNQVGGALVTGKLDCQPTNSATIEYNDNIMSSIRQRLGAYRVNNLSLSKELR